MVFTSLAAAARQSIGSLTPQPLAFGVLMGFQVAARFIVSYTRLVPNNSRAEFDGSMTKGT